MSLQVGDPAPDFKLPGTEVDPVSLSAFRGEKNVVVLFFPLAWTGVCTNEMCSIRDSHSKYEELDAQVLGISVDSPFALKAWSKEQGFNFPLLSDFNREAARDYDALYDELMGFKGVAKRAAFVIDKEGIVRYAEVLEKASDLPNFEAIQESLSSLR